MARRPEHRWSCWGTVRVRSGAATEAGTEPAGHAERGGCAQPHADTKDVIGRAYGVPP